MKFYFLMVANWCFGIFIEGSFRAKYIRIGINFYRWSFGLVIGG